MSPLKTFADQTRERSADVLERTRNYTVVWCEYWVSHENGEWLDEPGGIIVIIGQADDPFEGVGLAHDCVAEAGRKYGSGRVACLNGQGKPLGPIHHVLS